MVDVIAKHPCGERGGNHALGVTSGRLPVDVPLAGFGDLLDRFLVELSQLELWFVGPDVLHKGGELVSSVPDPAQ